MGAEPRRVLALDIGGTKLAAAITDSNGRIDRTRTAPTNAGAGAAAALENAISLAISVLDAERAAGASTGAPSVEAVGVSTMGITREDGVRWAPNVPGWSNLRIPGRLRSAFGGLPVTIVNDVKAATQAELTWGTLRGVGTGLYVNLGTGIAAGLVVDHRVVTGANGAAGEFGYVVPSAADLPPALSDAALSDTAPSDAAPSGSGGVAGPAPLEERIGGLGAARRASRELGFEVTVERLFELAQRDDRAAGILDGLLAEIGMWVGNLAVIADPEVVSLGGGLMRSPGRVLGRVTELVRHITIFPPRVVVARFGADAALAGAGAAALGALPPTGPANGSPTAKEPAPANGAANTAPKELS
jgi:glucokinase